MSLGLQLLFLVVFIIVMLLFGANLRRRRRKIIFFGDSITEYGGRPGGYVAFVKESLQDEGLDIHHDIINAGRSGNTVHDLVLRLEKDVILAEPKVVVLYIGVNDIWNKQKHGGGTDIYTFKEKYEKLVQRMQMNKVKLLLVTPAIIGENSTENKEEWEDLATYGNAIKEIGRINEIPVVDLHAAFKQFYITRATTADEGILTTDGVHLNVNGNRLVAENIWRMLKHLL